VSLTYWIISGVREERGLGGKKVPRRALRRKVTTEPPPNIAKAEGKLAVLYHAGRLLKEGKKGGKKKRSSGLGIRRPSTKKANRWRENYDGSQARKKNLEGKRLGQRRTNGLEENKAGICRFS